jgi:hypothetical protein
VYRISPQCTLEQWQHKDQAPENRFDSLSVGSAARWRIHIVRGGHHYSETTQIAWCNDSGSVIVPDQRQHQTIGDAGYSPLLAVPADSRAAM